MVFLVGSIHTVSDLLQLSKCCAVNILAHMPYTVFLKVEMLDPGVCTF